MQVSRVRVKNGNLMLNGLNDRRMGMTAVRDIIARVEISDSQLVDQITSSTRHYHQ
jgi:hypothetical protein